MSLVCPIHPKPSSCLPCDSFVHSSIHLLSSLPRHRRATQAKAKAQDTSTSPHSLLPCSHENTENRHNFNSAQQIHTSSTYHLSSHRIHILLDPAATYPIFRATSSLISSIPISTRCINCFMIFILIACIHSSHFISAASYLHHALQPANPMCSPHALTVCYVQACSSFHLKHRICMYALSRARSNRLMKSLPPQKQAKPDASKNASETIHNHGDRCKRQSPARVKSCTCRGKGKERKVNQKLPPYRAHES